MKLKKNNLKSLNQFVDDQYGKRGAAKREKFEKGYKEFRLGVLLQEAPKQHTQLHTPL